MVSPVVTEGESISPDSKTVAPLITPRGLLARSLWFALCKDFPLGPARVLSFILQAFSSASLFLFCSIYLSASAEVLHPAARASCSRVQHVDYYKNSIIEKGWFWQNAQVHEALDDIPQNARLGQLIISKVKEWQHAVNRKILTRLGRHGDGEVTIWFYTFVLWWVLIQYDPL